MVIAPSAAVRRSRSSSWAILLAVLVISWKGAEMDPLLLFKDAGNMA
ncbi:phosphonate ABC transporter, permease protein PhnE, partial [Enterobacter cloacae]